MMPSSPIGETRRKAAPLGAVLLCAVSLLCAAQAAAAAPNWLEPGDLSKPGRDASNPAVAMDPAGNTVAIWERQSTLDPSFNLQIATRAPGGTFTAPADFALKSTEPQLAMSPSGEAVAIWKHFENPPGVYTIQMATRPPGGSSFSPPVTVYTAAPTVIPQGPRLAVGADGTVAVTWSEVDPNSGFDKLVCGVDPNTSLPFYCPNPSFVMGAVRSAGGAFTPAQRISPPRGVETLGEDPKVKEEREIAESAKSAAGARPVVDAAGNTTVVFSYFNGEDNVIETAVRDAGGSFAAPVQVSAPGGDASSPEIGVDGAGNAIATWARDEGAARMVQAALKPPGGSFAPLGNLSPAGAVSERPVIGVGSDGTATIAWRLAGVSEDSLQSVTRPPGGSFSSPVSLSSGKDSPLFHEIAVSDEGDAVVTWSGDNGAEEIVRAAVRPAGGAFGGPVAISQSSPDFFHPHASADAGGDATVVWVRDNGTHNIVQMAGYDADPPQLRNVSIPSSGTVGSPVQYSASSFDVWPVGKPSFDFGDGAAADGTAVSHTYAAPGSYVVKVTAKDAVGKTVTSSGTILVKARNHFTIGKLKRNRKKGTATLTVTVPEPGTVVLAGKWIRKATVRTAKGGVLKVRIKAAGRGLRRLNKRGKLKARLRIAYSPDGGDTSTQQRRVTLQKTLS
jgi:PKD repeat protein